MAEQALALPPLPDTKAKGWEFTDISALDFDSYATAEAEAVIKGGGGASVMDLAEAAESRPDLVERLGALV
ncbi:MAG TPA: hypothetical protein VNR67_04260, partial [Solirubrobacterales bacterium]|nr:hypothetical protein [Solirubrobacterales bacterium]